MAKKIISVNNLGKRFFLNEEFRRHNTLRDFISEIPKKILTRRRTLRKRQFWALKDINFDLGEGEVLGLIGRNGTGKSTLLKILARIYPPTRGLATINGKVASILEVGTGFHTELTGRENIYLSGAILGMKRSEIDKKFRSIVEFSGVSRFLDMPIKRYSSGMQVRLAFSVASHLDSDVLLVDEVLAVGDASFQRKSLNKMRKIAKEEGRTVIFVSHSMSAVDALCSKVLLLESGKVEAYGESGKIISHYLKGISKEEEGEKKNLGKRSIAGNGKVKITDFWTENPERRKTNFIKSGGSCYFVFKYKTPDGRSKKDIDMGFSVRTLLGERLFLHYMSYERQTAKIVPPKGLFVFRFDRLPLAAGEYQLSFRITVGGKEADQVDGAANLRVEEGDYFNTGYPVFQSHSPMYVDGKWKVE